MHRKDAMNYLSSGVDHALEALLAHEEGDQEAFLYHREAYQAQVTARMLAEEAKQRNYKRFGVPYYVPVSER